jgi:hypothetical protein
VEARSELRRGEVLQAIFPALSQPPTAGGSVPAELMAAVLAADHLSRRRRRRAQARESMFPLAARMIIGLTNQRLIIWKVRPGWRLGPFIGYVSRDRVLQVTAPPVAGTGWRNVSVFLAEEPTVSIKVPAGAAADLGRELSGRPDLTDHQSDSASLLSRLPSALPRPAGQPMHSVAR